MCFSLFVVFLIASSFIECDCIIIGHINDMSRLNYFDMDLLRFAAENSKGNVMVSPPSIKSSLAMILEGARGDTAAEIRSALRLSPNKDEFREQLNRYLSAIQLNTTETVLQNANAVFISKDLQLKKEYDLMLKNVYMSEISKISFDSPINASDIINEWVSRKTEGLIPSIVDPVNITPRTDIVLVNALYFKSLWKHSFDPKNTRAACFYNNGVCNTVAMMDIHAQLNYAYVQNLRSHAVELPYEGDRYSMILLVPKDRDGAATLIRDLPYMSLPQISELLEPSDVEFSMPKFTIDYSEDLVEVLKEMRITTLFSSKADLSGIFDGNSTDIDHILHKVHMTVDESGTVAAASSAGLVIPLIQGVVQLRVDKPFVFFIRDNKLGLVLFEGRIDEPADFVQKDDANIHMDDKDKKNVKIP